MNRTRRSAAVLLAAAALAAAGCSTKAQDSGGGGSSSGGVKTGPGVSGDEITLGVLTDLTGAFAALGKDVTNANNLFWEQQNAKGGVCNKYKVKLDVKDHGYVVQNGVQLYSSIKNDVLALQHTIGSPINTALEQQLEADKMLNIPEAWARNLTNNKYNMVVGATYDVEMINLIDYALKNGKLKDGDTVGHIYFEGEYGANGLAGTKHMAEKHGFKVIEAKIKATDQDMSAQITNMKAQGVKAIMLTVAPAQTASAASVAAAQGLNVPLLGNNPVFAPGLLKGPAGAALKESLLLVSPVVSFDKAGQLLKDYQGKYNASDPTLGVVHGYADSKVMHQVLEQACKDGDLTRDGLFTAKQELSEVSTDGLVSPLTFKTEGESPTKQNYIMQPADVPGGLKTITDLYTSSDAEAFKPGG